MLVFGRLEEFNRALYRQLLSQASQRADDERMIA